MSMTTTQARAHTALQLLAGREPDLAHDDSEDELHADIEPKWEWILSDDAPGAANGQNDPVQNEDSPSKQPHRARRPLSDHRQPQIIGARLGRFVIHVGDTVTLKADRNDVWVALIKKFLDPSLRDSDAESDAEDSDDDEDNDEDGRSGKKALFTWLSSPREVRNPRHRRNDCLPNELYATANSDVNPLEAIIGRATLLSPTEFLSRFPNGSIPKGHLDTNRVFVCRRGANLRTNTYTDEFKWGVDVMPGVDRPQEVEDLIEKVERETVTTRKKRRMGADTSDGLKDFIVDDNAVDNEGGDPQTPRKKRKLDTDITPRRRGPGATPKRTPASKFSTPTHRRIVEKRPLEFTPLGTRLLSPSQGAYLASPHAQARTQLHVASVPASLPCREEEFSTVYTALESAISDGTGACIYISGTPGTGKTATVREVVAQLSAAAAASELDDFLFVEINGMRLADPHDAYSALWEALTGARVAAPHALSLLSAEFSRPSPRRVPVVVLMDELDALATRSQGVMYNFFQWPGLRHARLIVLAVANTMDLPERTLSNKISSRLGLARIVFQGYSHTQLMRIVETRLAGVPGAVVEPDAVQFAARKVAGVSGDARRCLDICRRAVELAEQDARDAPPPSPSKGPRAGAGAGEDARGRVTIATVQRAIRESTSSPMQQYLRAAPLAAKLFLAALLARSRRTGVAESAVGDVRDEAKKLAGMSELPALRDWLLSDAPPDDDTVGGGGGGGGGGGDAPNARRRKGMPKRVLASDAADGAVVGAGRIPAPRVLGLAGAAAELQDAGVVAVEERRGERGARCRLLVGDEDVKAALRGDDEVRGLGFNA